MNNKFFFFIRVEWFRRTIHIIEEMRLETKGVCFMLVLLQQKKEEVEVEVFVEEWSGVW